LAEARDDRVRADRNPPTTKLMNKKKVLAATLIGITALVGVLYAGKEATDPAVGGLHTTVADRPLVFDAILRDQASCPEVNTTELSAALENASAVVLDARPDDEYAVSHIPGARAVPGKPGTTPALYVADVNIDARETAGLTPQLRNARSIPLRDSSKAKDDGRLPMTDHNTRIFVVGNNAAQARAVAEAIVHDAFQNVSFFDGSIADLTELYEK
jgi:rhodanese-related sulfurtransferase